MINDNNWLTSNEGKLLKICVVTTAFPRWEGDNRAPFIYGWVKALHDMGVQVRVIAMHNPGAKSKEYMEGIEVIRLRYLPEKLEVMQLESGGIPVAWKKRPLSRLTLIPFLMVHTFSVAKYARGFDLVHANWTLSAFSAWISYPFHNKPFIATVLGSDIYEGAQNPLIASISKFILMHALKIISPSKALAEETSALGLPAEKIGVVYNGINTDVFHPGKKEKGNYLLFVGSLIERKGAQYLICAFARVIKDHPDYRLIIIGEGSEKEKLIELTQSLSLSNHIEFLGSLSQNEVGEWMRQAAIFICPSIEEALGQVLLEAMSSGIPIIASNVGGIPEVITPDVGILVKPEDPDALADAIHRLIIDKQVALVMGKKGRLKVVQHYTWKCIAKQLLEIYAEVL